MAIVETITHLMAPWAEYYRNSKPAEIGVTYAHVGGMLVSGGLAIATDRSSVRARRATAVERSWHLRELATVHRPVIVSLVVVLISGLALAAADVETYAVSIPFWIKMGLIALLMVNGLIMWRAEGRLGRAPEDATSWRTLRVTSIVSGALWLVIALVGVVLVDAA